MHMYAHVYKTIDGYTYTYLYFIFDIYIMLSIHQIFLLVLNNFFTKIWFLKYNKNKINIHIKL